MTPKQLREKRTEVGRQIKALADLVNTQHRDFSAEETGRWDALNGEYDLLTRKIEVLERGERIDADLGPAAVNNPRGIGRGDVNADAGAFGEIWIDQRTGREVHLCSRAGPSVRQRILSEDAENPFRNLSLGAYLRAISLGPRNDLERRALSEGTDSAGGFTTPSVTMGELIDRLRAKQVTMRAGARIVRLETDNTTIARIDTDPTATWRAENAAVAESDPVFAGVTFAPKTLAVIVRASRELVEDSINLEQALATVFAGALGTELDRVALEGSGSGSQPRGIRNTTGVTELSMGVNGAALTRYQQILTLTADLLEVNSDFPTAAVFAPRTWETLAKLEDTLTQPIPKSPALEPVSFLVTNSVPINETQGTASNASHIIMSGHWDQLLIGIRTALRIQVLKERYADNLQFGFLAYLRADIALARPAAFGRLIGIIP